MLPNEVFALECIARYAREGLVVNRRTIHNGRRAQFAHCPEPRPEGQKYRLSGDKGYWLTFEDHQHQGLLQSVDFDRRCFYLQDTSLWLDTKPPGYEELYVIYKHYISGEHSSGFGVPRTETQKKAQSERMSGEKNPNYNKFGAAHNRSKAIIVIKPDGTEEYFVSIREADRDLGINQGNLCKYLKTGKQPKKGKFKGWQFFYA